MNRRILNFYLPLVFPCLFLFAGRPALAIISGDPVPANDPVAATSVAFIQDDVPNTEFPTGIERDACSGTIFADDTIVTAAHCLRESPVGKTLVFAVNIYDSGTISRLIDDYAVDPEYIDGYADQPVMPKNNSDIALLHFKGGLPSAFHPANLVATEYKITGREPMIIAGYGILSPPKVDSNGVVIDPYGWLGDGILRLATSAILDPNYAATEIEVSESSQSYASSGDSGGPAFINVNGQYQFIGVDNWGDVKDGLHFEVYADVRSHLTWINTAIASFRAKSE